MASSASRNVPKAKPKAPVPGRELARKGLNTTTMSSGSANHSRVRLLTNNKSLALQLNKKRMENRRLRETVNRLNGAVLHYKGAYKNLQRRLEATNESIRNLQNMSPVIHQDVMKMFAKYNNFSNTLAAINVDEIENTPLLNKLDMQESSQKPKTQRKRTRAINKVRPMKYGLVLGDPVVSLHRLHPRNILSTIPQQSESDGYTDSETENIESLEDVDTGSGQTSPSSPIASQTQTSIPHHRVAELTLSVPVLQSIESSTSRRGPSPKKRQRLTGLVPANVAVLKRQELQLKSPCRVVIEKVQSEQSRKLQVSLTDVMSPVASPASPPEVPQQLVPNVSQSARVRRRRGRPAKIRQVHSDGEVETPKKLSDEELKKKFTPLQVAVTLEKVRIGEASEESPTIARRKPRKSLPAPTYFGSDSSDSSDDDFVAPRVNPILLKSPSIDGSKITVRGKSKSSKKGLNSPEAPSLLKVKFACTKGPSSRKRTTSASSNGAEKMDLKTTTAGWSRIRKEADADRDKADKTDTSPKLARVAPDEKKPGQKTVKGPKQKANQTSEEKVEGDKKEEPIRTPEPDQYEKADQNLEDDLSEEPMLLDTPQDNLNTTYIVTAKPKITIEPPTPPVETVVKEAKIKTPQQAPSRPHATAKNASESKEDAPKPQPAPAPLVENPKPKPKKARPMPLSKKIALGLVPDPLKAASPEAAEKKEKDVQTEVEGDDDMQNFLRRVSMEDPLEGTSRQHVYKKPNPVPSPSSALKKSLRQLDRKSYQESPFSDNGGTDEDLTWYPNKNISKKK